MKNQTQILMHTKRLELVLPDVSYLNIMVAHMEKKQATFQTQYTCSRKILYGSFLG